MIDRILSFNVDEYLAWYETASLLMNCNEFAELKAEQLQRKAVIYRGLLERFNTNSKENVKSGECAKKIMDMIFLEKQEFSPLQYFPAANYWFPTGDQWEMIKEYRTTFIQVDIEKIGHSISVLSNGTHLVKDKLNELNNSGLNFGDSILNKYPIYSTGNEPNKLRDFITDINRIDLVKWLYDQLPIEPENEGKKDKIRWIGKPTQLGYIMNELATNGYIEAPIKKNGEINYSEFARQIVNVFDFDGNSYHTISNSVNPAKNNMETNHKEKIQIPHIKDIS